MDWENLLSGDGSAADFLNATGADAIYGDNQSMADVLDNGAVTSSDQSTTVSSPGWMGTLNSLLGLAGNTVNTVKPLLGSTTGAPATSATATAAAAAAKSSQTSLYIIIGVVAAVLGSFLLFRRS